MPEPPKIPFFAWISRAQRDFFSTPATSKWHLWASEVGQADFQEPWDHTKLTFCVRSHLSGTLWTEKSPLDVKEKKKWWKRRKGEILERHSTARAFISSQREALRGVQDEQGTPGRGSWAQGRVTKNSLGTPIPWDRERAIKNPLKLEFPSSLPQRGGSHTAIPEWKLSLFQPERATSHPCPFSPASMI